MDNQAGEVIEPDESPVAPSVGGTEDRPASEPPPSGEEEVWAGTASGVGFSSVEVATKLGEIHVGCRELVSQQDELKTLFEERIRFDEVQSKAFEKLHDQLREFKANFVRQEMKPLLHDIIACYDTAADEAQRAQQEGGSTALGDPASAFEHLQQMIADVLMKYDVEPYRSPGPEFDRREQQCVGIQETDDQAVDKHVARLGATGFRMLTSILRKEQVVVYKWKSQ